MASVAVLTAVSKPKVAWVPQTSLSIVFGTPTTGMPLAQRSWAMLQAAVAADRDERIDPAWRSAAISSSERSSSPLPSLSMKALERIAPVGRAEDGAAEVHDATDVVGQAHQPLNVSSPVSAVDPITCQPRRRAARMTAR